MDAEQILYSLTKALMDGYSIELVNDEYTHNAIEGSGYQGTLGLGLHLEDLQKACGIEPKQENSQ
jgi:hypothetical protein